MNRSVSYNMALGGQGMKHNLHEVGSGFFGFSSNILGICVKSALTNSLPCGSGKYRTHAVL